MFPEISPFFKPCYASAEDEKVEIIKFARSIGVSSLLDKEDVRKVFVAMVQNAMVEKRKQKYPFILWLYLDACSDFYGIDGYSAGHHQGWNQGVGKFLRDGLTEEEFAFITAEN
jgi:hypothetical protein